MQRAILLDDEEHAHAIDDELRYIRDSGALGRSTKLHSLFDYLVERSRNGPPPREIEIAQDVFGRSAQASDDGSARVYVHRLRRRLEEIYSDRSDSELRIALPLGEYRLVAEIGPAQVATGRTDLRALARPPLPWRLPIISAVIGAAVAAFIVVAILPWPTPGWRAAEQTRSSQIWAPLFANGLKVVIAEGDHYLFQERQEDGKIVRLVRDTRIRSRDELDAYLLRHPQDADRFADIGAGYIPRTVPRAQAYLWGVLSAAPSVRVLPASQLPADAMLSQNIVYLGLTSGLGPIRSPVASGSRFDLGLEEDTIFDRRTKLTYRGNQTIADNKSPHRQFALLSLFAGKEGNRYVVLAGTSEMGLVGLVEALADPERLQELGKALGSNDTAEALYQIDSQGGGVLAIRLLVTNVRDRRTVWAP